MHVLDWGFGVAETVITPGPLQRQRGCTRPEKL